MKISNNSLFRFFGIILIFVFLLSLLGFNEQIAEANNSLDQMEMAKSEVTQQNISDEVPNQPQDLSDTKDEVELAAWRNLRPTEKYLREVSMLPNPESIDCDSADQKSKGWIVGDDGLILSYCNGVWDHAQTTESIPTTLFGVKAISPTLAYAVGEGGTILKYGWDTVANNYVWIKLPIVISNKEVYGLVILEEDQGNYSAWAVGQKDDILNKGAIIRGTITKTTQNDPNGHPIYTQKWTNVTADYPALPTSNYYFSLYALSKNDIWAVGGNATSNAGSAIHWNGTTWTYYEVGQTPLYGVYFISPENGWAAGEGGYIYHFNGTSWSLHSQPTKNVIVDFSEDSEGIGWATGFDGTILKYNENFDE